MGIAACHVSGECVLANEALARITGGTVKQLCAQNFRRLKRWLGDGQLAIGEQDLQPAEVLRA